MKNPKTLLRTSDKEASLDVVDSEDAAVVGQDLSRREEVVQRRVLWHVTSDGAGDAKPWKREVGSFKCL